jgi:hypothetical protein
VCDVQSVTEPSARESEQVGDPSGLASAHLLGGAIEPGAANELAAAA